MQTRSALTWRNIVGYGLGDMANNFVFAMGALFLLNYYTDVAGIPAAAAGTLLAVLRVYSAVTDVVAGRVVDRTSTRWGCCRPFLLWGGPPLLLLSVLVFSVPAGWSAEAKLVFAYVTYGLTVTAYSFVNIPYGSLAGMMSQAPQDRARLSVSRSFISTASFALLAVVVGAAVRSHPGGALQARLIWITLALAAGGSVLYFLCFRATREVVGRQVERPKLKDSLGIIFVNRALLILCATMMCMMAGTLSMTASGMYFARYILGDAGLLPVIFVTTTLFGVLVSVTCTSMLVRRFGKKGTFLLGIAVAVAGFLALYFFAGAGRVWIFALLGVVGAGKMTAAGITWALAADTVEYGEWRTGVRIEGLTYSLFSFSRKCGQALGGSVPAFLLAASGYVPNLAAQSEGVREAILQAMVLAPAVAFSLVFVLMLFYPLSDARFTEMLEDIQRKKAAEAPLAP